MHRFVPDHPPTTRLKTTAEDIRSRTLRTASMYRLNNNTNNRIDPERGGKLPLPSDHPATPDSWRMRDRLFRSHSNHSASAEDVTPRQFSADGTFGKELIKLLQERKVTLLWRVDPTYIKRSETDCCNLSLVRYKLRCQQALISRPAGAARELSTIGKLVGAFQRVVFLFSLLIHLPGREYSGYG